ncbi:MAG: VWA domain-containing protein, partial [Pyrinomonadaceae bacterium]
MTRFNIQQGLFLIITGSLCLLPMFGSASAQDPKITEKQTPAEADTVIRVNTELVQTDVMVFDKKGRFVEGLQPEQFELSVNGKPQPISFFESVVTGSKKEVASLRAARATACAGKLPEPSEVAATTEPGRTILFFIDDHHLTPNNLARTRRSLLEFIDKIMGPNDQAAITSASGQIGFLQQLTNNRTVLRTAIERLNYVPYAVVDNERPAMSEYAALLIAEQNDRGGKNPGGPPDASLFEYFVQQTMKANNVERPIAVQIVERRARRIVQQSDFVNRNVMSTVAELMSSIGRLPGRKLVFFMSEGFVANYHGSDISNVLHRAIDAAAAAGAVVYSLDLRGLSNNSWVDASNSGGFDPTGVLSSRLGPELSSLQEPLHALAGPTGGRALVNSNSFINGIERALDETSRYYLLAWRPESEEQRKGNHPKIIITIAQHPDLKVLLRKGYLGAPLEKRTSGARPSAPLTSKELVSMPDAAVLG